MRVERGRGGSKAQQVFAYAEVWQGEYKDGKPVAKQHDRQDDPPARPRGRRSTRILTLSLLSASLFPTHLVSVFLARRLAPDSSLGRQAAILADC